MNKSKKIILTLITAIIGGFTFSLLHIPVPWLLGPMIAVLTGTNLLNCNFYWPSRIRNTGMIIVGYTIGLSMTSAALHEMSLQLPFMLLMTVLLLLFCAGIAFIASKLSDSDYRTLLLASIPGGLSQIVILAEETEGINLAVVTITQVIRLIIIIIAMPIIVMFPMFGGINNIATPSVNIISSSASWSGMFPNLIIFAVICVLFALLCAKIKFPTAYLIGPATGSAILQSFGLEGPELPAMLINMAQLMIGTYVGLLLTPDQMPRKIRTFILAIGSGLMIVVGGIILGVILTIIQPISMATGLLSLAPGGMDQMGIIAHEIQADLYIVSGYQLFRTFFIFFAVPPILKILFRIFDRNREKEKSPSN